MTTAAVRSATDPRPRRGPVGRRALQVVLFLGGLLALGLLFGTRAHAAQQPALSLPGTGATITRAADTEAESEAEVATGPARTAVDPSGRQAADTVAGTKRGPVDAARIASPGKTTHPPAQPAARRSVSPVARPVVRTVHATARPLAPAASADELPVSLPLSTPDHSVDAADVVNGVDGAEELGNLTDLGNSKGLGSLTDNIKDTVRTKATGARGEAKAAEATSAAKGATAAEPARRAVAVQDQVAGAADKATGTLHDAISRSDVLAPQGILDEQVLQGVHGDAVAPFAQGVTGRVMPLAHGVGAQAQPFAGGLVGTVGDDVRPAAGNAAHGAEGLTSITPAYVTDATGSVPSFGAPEYPARSI
ncbi:hypothetical protein ACFXPY_37470 [Streptomyces sp. NPDC059153]|uniref:hypothetical protein n=1 Tax=Streptomyces sp. NPDC059153 TaxID=3346743 RepID=UPI00369ECE21